MATKKKRGGLGGAFNRAQNPLKQANEKIEALEQKLEHARQGPRADARLVPLITIRTDGDTQPREAMSTETIQEYASRMRFDEAMGAIVDPNGEPFPPVILYEDGDLYWLADGFHRVSAAREAGLDQILATVHEGTRRDAFVGSLSANAAHGLRRTNADKRRAVTRALRDDELVTYTDAWLAELCDVSRPFVTQNRKRLEADNVISFQDRLQQQDGAWMDVTREPETHPSVEEPVTASVKPASGRATRAQKPADKSAQSASEHAVSFETLDAVKLPRGAATIVAYPTLPTHFEALVTGLAARMKKGRLLILFPQADPNGLANLAALAPLASEHGFEPARCVLITPHDRHFLAFERGVERIDLVTSAESLGLPDLLVGVVLDDWS